MGGKTAPSPDLIARTRWYIKLRWYLLLGITIPTVLSLYIGGSQKMVELLSVILTISLFFVNGLFFILSRLKHGRTYFRTLAFSLLAFDGIFITFFIYDRGGIESRVVVLYAIPIIMSALFFGRAGIYATAGCSAALYDIVVAGNYIGLFHNHNEITNEGSDLSYVLYSMVFFTAILMMIAVLTDFLTRLLIQKQREASATAEALRRAQEIAKIRNWEWDPQTDHLQADDELYKVIKRPKEKFLTLQSLIRYLHPEDREQTRKMFTKAVREGIFVSFENRFLLPDQTSQVIHIEARPLKNRKGKVIKLYGIAQDITSERALETAKGDFVALASHQLRTPASGVRMLLAMLRDGYVGTLSPEQLQAVEEAFVANDHLLRISDDLLNIAKLESGRLRLTMQEIELCRWLKNVVAPQKLLAREHHQRMRLSVPKGAVYLKGDSDRLAMVLDNLLSNARKYTPPRGSIEVILQPGRSVHKIIISDTGYGMKKSERSRLFQKFTRVDNPGSRGVEGVGLGLYLAKNIIDLHGGRIRVRSQAGQGSTFTVTLPVNH